MESTTFWDITLYSPLKVTDVSEEHIASIFRVEELAEQETSVKAGGKQNPRLHAGFLLGLFFDPRDGDDVLPKRRLTLTELHGVISQKTELFITTAVRTSNPI
jgi:hypothetical protein